MSRPPVIEMLQEVGSHPRPSATCYGVREHEALQTVTVISLSIKDVEYLLMETPGLCVGRYREEG